MLLALLALQIRVCLEVVDIGARNYLMHSTQEILAIVKKSGALGKSLRQFKLLEYLFTQQELGLTSSIKAYSIALDVFGRSKNFENSRDSIVRVEMFRLRKNLKAFNSTSDAFTLHLARRSYFVKIKEKPESIGLTLRYKIVLFCLFTLITSLFISVMFYWLSHPQPKISTLCSDIVPNVTIIKNSNSNSNSDSLADIVHNAFTSTLLQQSSVNIIEPTKRCPVKTTPFYIVLIDAISINGNGNITITTSQDQLSNIFHSIIIDESAIELQQESNLFYTAVRSANDLGKMNGIIPRHAASVDWASSLAQENYTCLMITYDSFVSDSDMDYQKSLKCLEKSVNGQAPLLGNFGALARAYLFQKKGYRQFSVTFPLKNAEQILQKVGGKWINNTETVMATIHYEAERDNYNQERLKNILEISESHFPLNPQVLTLISVTYGFKIGDWEQAIRISNIVRRIHGERDNSVLLVDAAYTLINLQSNEPIGKCTMAYSKNSILSNLIVGACAYYINDEFWMKNSHTALSEFGLENREAIIQFIKNRQLEPVLSDIIIAAFQE